MGLLDRFRRTKKEASLFDRFAAWMDAAFEGGVPGEIAGVVLNLYEQADHRWSAEVVGTQDRIDVLNDTGLLVGAVVLYQVVQIGGDRDLLVDLCLEREY